MRGRWYLGKCCLKTDSGLLLKKIVHTARTLFWAANFCACPPGCYLTFISWTLFGLSNGRFLLKSISVLLSGFGRFLSSCFSVFLLACILLFSLCFFPKTQKDQKYFCCFSSPFVYLVLCSYFTLFDIVSLLWENPKRFCFVCLFPFVLVSNPKIPKIFVVLLWFCKVH